MVTRYRVALEQHPYAPSTINLRLAAIRRLVCSGTRIPGRIEFTVLDSNSRCFHRASGSRGVDLVTLGGRPAST